MRSTSRLFATVRSASKYLEPNIPTGLTGLSTHPLPRPALIYTYKETLNKLKQIPSSSVYRQSAEALTKQRLAILEETKPEGYEQWLERVRKQIDANPGAYNKLLNEDGSLGSEKLHIGQVDIWDGLNTKKDANPEGSNTFGDAEKKARRVIDEMQRVDKEAAEGTPPTVADLEVEPPLTREQYVAILLLAPSYMQEKLIRNRVDTIETKIGAGLIEEVLQVAEGELTLVETMLSHQVYVPTLSLLMDNLLI
jgi:hypothetical protein